VDQLGQMEIPTCQNTRRWPRYQVDLPVRIVALNGILTTPILARGSEISRAGMALRAAIGLKPGDVMQLQLPTSAPSRVTAVVRNRTRDSLGLEFLTQLPPDDRAKDQSPLHHTPVSGGSPQLLESARSSYGPEALYAGLRRKLAELRQVEREIEALNLAILLLADDENELSDSLCRIVQSRPRAVAASACKA
jgi:PilZ domain-containing protein